MNKLSSCTTLNFWFRPIGFPSKKFTPTLSQISRWDKEEVPNHFKSISPIGLAGELFAVIGGISSIFGFSKDNKYAKWGGGASLLAGIALFITALFNGVLKADKATEETSKSLKTITDEKDDTNRKKMIDDLIAQNNSDDLLQALKDILRDTSIKDSKKGIFEIISHLSNGQALILNIVKDKTYIDDVRDSAIVFLRSTSEEERKVLISLLKDEGRKASVRYPCISSIIKSKGLGYMEDLAKLLEEKDSPSQVKDDVLKKILNLPVEEIKTHVLAVLSTDSKLSVDELKTLESANDEKYAHLLFNALESKEISYLSKLMIYDSLTIYINNKELTEDFAKFIRENLLPKTRLNQIASINRTLGSFRFDSGFKYLKNCPLSESNIESIKLYKYKGWLFKEEIKDS